MAASALLSTVALRELPQLCLYTNTALPDMAHHMQNSNVYGVCGWRYQRAATAFAGGESIVNSEHVQGNYGAS